MGWNFDGVNDSIDFGSDATVDAFTTKAIAGWVIYSASLAGTAYMIIGKDRFFTGWAVGNTGAAGDKLRFTVQFGSQSPEWLSVTDMGTTRKHFVWIYDGSNTTNDPTLYINGVAETPTEAVAPLGSMTSDAANALRAGTNSANGLDYNGKLAHLCYDSTIANWNAAAAVRAMYWGRPHGGLKVYHPLLTAKLTNEGTATANGTASGAVVTSFPTPTVRPCQAMLGMNVGW